MEKNKNLLPVNFTYKARIFEMLYSDKKELLMELVKKKLKKNKLPETIAEELEEDISTIKEIITKCSE